MITKKLFTKLLKSKIFKLFIVLSILYPILNSVGSTHHIFTLQNNKTIIFLDAEQGYKYTTKSDFIENLTILDISLRIEKECLFNDLKKHKKEYFNFHKKQFKNWSFIDEKFVLCQLKKSYSKIDSFFPMVLPDTLYLIRTTGKQEFNSFYTCKNAIICPSSIRLSSTYLPFIGYIRQYIERVFIHEIFHIFSSNNVNIRNELYNLIGFEKIDNLYIPPELNKKIIHNPDDKSHLYKISLKDKSTGKVDNYNLMILSKYPKWEGYIDFPARLNVLLVYMESGFLQIKKENKNWTVVQDNKNQIAIKNIDSFSDYYEKVGLKNGAISPEEIVAHLFIDLVKSKFDDKILKNKPNTYLDILGKIESLLIKY